jgi:hypothetical protein
LTTAVNIVSLQSTTNKKQERGQQEMDGREAADRIREQTDIIYEALDGIKRVLKEFPGAYERAERYWLAHIDGALENRGGWLGGSMISAEDTIRELEESEDEEGER